MTTLFCKMLYVSYKLNASIGSSPSSKINFIHIRVRWSWSFHITLSKLKSIKTQVLKTFNESSICIILVQLTKTLSSICIISKAFSYCLTLTFYVKRVMNSFLPFSFTLVHYLPSFLKIQRLINFKMSWVINLLLNRGKIFCASLITGNL
jgi:hypothetical protein